MALLCGHYLGFWFLHFCSMLLSLYVLKLDFLVHFQFLELRLLSSFCVPIVVS